MRLYNSGYLLLHLQQLRLKFPDPLVQHVLNWTLIPVDCCHLLAVPQIEPTGYLSLPAQRSANKALPKRPVPYFHNSDVFISAKWAWS